MDAMCPPSQTEDGERIYESWGKIFKIEVSFCNFDSAESQDRLRKQIMSFFSADKCESLFPL